MPNGTEASEMPSAGSVERIPTDRDSRSVDYASAAYFWSAPLPRPEVLARYNEAFPGCAERIVSMAEQQAIHRQALELTVVRGNTRSQTAGLWLGFVLALIVVLSGAWLVHEGRVAWGAGFITIPLVSLVSIFVYGKRQQTKELSTPDEPATSQQKSLSVTE